MMGAWYTYRLDANSIKADRFGVAAFLLTAEHFFFPVMRARRALPTGLLVAVVSFVLLIMSVSGHRFAVGSIPPVR